jgi:hypothetical protein
MTPRDIDRREDMLERIILWRCRGLVGYMSRMWRTHIECATYGSLVIEPYNQPAMVSQVWP